MKTLPKWVDLTVVPLLSLFFAAILASLVILAIGENPITALVIMVKGALGSTYAWGYTLFYATNFVFTGLAVSIAFQAKLFNIGGEGQATLGGLGVALVCLYIPMPHWTISLIVASLSGALFGALWAFLPAILQAKRGSHVVITTIMFNFIAAALLNFLLVGVLHKSGSMDPATEAFPATTNLPKLGEMLGTLGIPFSEAAPANASIFVALAACGLVWLILWRTSLGYEIRAFGQSEPAAIYAGINPTKIVVVTMMLSGGLAGMMAINNVLGDSQRLVLGAVEGAGFIGIAVALMGRSHPVGVLMASLLFGFLYQGGTELSLATGIPREMIVVIQSMVILFTGAWDNMTRDLVRSFLALRGPTRSDASGVHPKSTEAS